MGWASEYITQLNKGLVVSFRPTGNSMSPLIESGSLVTVAPVNDLNYLQINDIVLCEVNGRQYLHLIKDIDIKIEPFLFLIGNNHGKINGWTDQIFGILINNMI